MPPYWYPGLHKRGKKFAGNAKRQGGTGATYSGMQQFIRHANSDTFTIESGKMQAFDLVTYNNELTGTPLDLDGSSTKVLSNNYCSEGSRVDYVTVQLTISQTDTTKNNQVYTGFISTSFNEGRLNSALMTTNFNDFIESDESAGKEGNMKCFGEPKNYDLNTYSLKDIQQHNIKRLLSPQIQLYSGRVAQMNQTIPLPRKNRRQQQGSLFALCVLNDSETGATPEGSDINVRLDTFFKEIPVNAL